MQYIIMCGGPRSWKPLQKVAGQTLVGRTIDLLRRNNITDIAISTNDNNYEPISTEFGVPILNHDNPMSWDGFVWLRAFYPATEPTCYVYGDVFFSPEAIRTIVETETDDIEFFASAPPFDKQYIKRWAEPFAFKVQDINRFFACVATAKKLGDLGRFKRIPCSWELWQVIKNTELNKINYKNYTVINDYTCDVDGSEEVARIEKIQGGRK